MAENSQASVTGETRKPIITIIAALNCEAKPWVDFYGLKKQCDSPFRYYAKDGVAIEVVISGIGSIAMAAAIGWIGASAAHPRAWLNLGIAGHATKPIGSICRVHSVVNATDLAKYHPPLVAKWKGESSAIASVNAPTNSYAEGAMIDMESYAFFKAATLFSPSELVQSIKVISDNQEQGFEELNAAKITALMLPHIEQVNNFSAELVALCPERKIEHPWQALLLTRSSHSQGLQLDELLSKACVLGLHAQVASLGLESQTPVKTSIDKLKALLAKSAPDLSEVS